MWTVCWIEGNKRKDRWDRFESKEEVVEHLKELHQKDEEWFINMEDVLVIPPHDEETNGYEILAEEGVIQPFDTL